jgi:glycosyltransferase involved in cell wall biosynthesis
MKLKFSIITVVKNDEKHIARTIKSVIKQNYNNIQYIIIDGNSKDSTLKIINSYKNNIDKIISEPDNGIYEAMNKGIELSSGDIICFCNSGDILRQNAIETIAKYFMNTKIDFVFGAVWRFYRGKKILKYNFQPNRIKYNFDCYTSHSTGFYIRNQAQKKIGKYNPKFKCSADYDLFYRMIIKFNMNGLNTTKSEIIGVVRSGGYSSTLNYVQHLLEETKIRISNKQNIIFVTIIFMTHFFKKTLKKIFY